MPADSPSRRNVTTATPVGKRPMTLRNVRESSAMLDGSVVIAGALPRRGSAPLVVMLRCPKAEDQRRPDPWIRVRSQTTALNRAERRVWRDLGDRTGRVRHSVSGRQRHRVGLSGDGAESKGECGHSNARCLSGRYGASTRGGVQCIVRAKGGTGIHDVDSVRRSGQPETLASLFEINPCSATRRSPSTRIYGRRSR
jgi:ribosomal protein L39E